MPKQLIRWAIYDSNNKMLQRTISDKKGDAIYKLVQKSISTPIYLEECGDSDSVEYQIRAYWKQSRKLGYTCRKLIIQEANDAG